MLPKGYRLADLYYGHPGKFIQSLRGPFDARLCKEPIKLGQLTCGCWVILDGNNRIGLILKKNLYAIIGNYDQNMFCFFETGEWDEELIQWWNPYLKTMCEILQLTKDLNKLIRNRLSFPDLKNYYKRINKLNSQINSKNHICISQTEKEMPASCI